jgi:hypothetical protein
VLFENLVSISGSRRTLKSIKGISSFKKLRSFKLENESLDDISELAQVTSIENVELGDSSTHEISVNDLASLPKLGILDLGGHKVIDPKSLLKFRADTTIRIKYLESQKY